MGGLVFIVETQTPRERAESFINFAGACVHI